VPVPNAPPGELPGTFASSSPAIRSNGLPRGAKSSSWPVIRSAPVSPWIVVAAASSGPDATALQVIAAMMPLFSRR
jgi:hypothetical protein